MTISTLGSYTKILATGGTASAITINPNELTRYKPNKNANQLLTNLCQKYPYIQSNYNVEVEDILHIDSKDLTWEHILMIEQAVYKACTQTPKVNIILICGTDNTESIAFALHLSQRIQDCIQKFDIRISLTGAMHSFDHIKSDGPQNIKHALIAVNSDLPPAVYLTFNKQVIYAPNIKKYHTQSINTFNLPKDTTCAIINIKENDKLVMQKGMQQVKDNINKYTRFNLPTHINAEQIFTLNSEININPIILKTLEKNIQKIKALIINGTGNGTYQNRLQSIIDKALEHNVLITRASRCNGDVNYVKGENILASRGLSIEKLLILNMIYISQVKINSITRSKMQNLYDEYADYATLPYIIQSKL